MQCPNNQGLLERPPALGVCGWGAGDRWSSYPRRMRQAGWQRAGSWACIRWLAARSPGARAAATERCSRGSGRGACAAGGPAQGDPCGPCMAVYQQLLQVAFKVRQQCKCGTHAPRLSIGHRGGLNLPCSRKRRQQGRQRPCLRCRCRRQASPARAVADDTTICKKYLHGRKRYQARLTSPMIAARSKACWRAGIAGAFCVKKTCRGMSGPRESPGCGAGAGG